MRPRPTFFSIPALVLVLLAFGTGGCSPAPPAVAVRQDSALTILIGGGARPARAPQPPASLRVTTVTPLSLWLFGAAPAPRAGLEIELIVVDADGRPTTNAVVQPRRLRTDASGFAAPITFLAAEAGEYLVRARIADGPRTIEAHSPRLIASPPPAR